MRAAMTMTSRLWVVALLGAGALAAPPDDAEELRERAVAEINAGRYAEALRLLDRAIAAAPADAHAWFLRGNAHIGLGDLARAEEDLDRALRHDPDYVDARVQRAAVRIDRNRLAEADDDLKRALEQDDEQWRTHYLLACVAYAQQRYKDALASVDRAIMLGIVDDSDVRSLHLKGRCLHAMGEYKLALEAFDSACWHARDSPPAAILFHRGLTFLALGDGSGALKDFDKAAAAAPDWIEIRYHRALARNKLGDRPGALADLDGYVEAWPDDADARYERGILLAQAGDHARAIADLDIALARWPDDAEALYHRALSRHLGPGTEEAARTDVDRAIQLGPPCGKYHLLLAAIRLDAGDGAAAGREYDRAIFLDPDLARAVVPVRRADAGLLRRRPQLYADVDLDKRPRGLALSPDDRTLVTGGTSGLMLWDAGNGLPIARFGGPANCVAYSPDGRQVVAAHTGGATLWDPESGEEIRTIPWAGVEVDCVEFSPGGRFLGLATPGRIRIVDARTFALLQEFPGYAESRAPSDTFDELPPSYRRFSFAADETSVLTTSERGAVQWDIASGRRLRAWGDGPTYSVALGPLGDVVFVGGMGTSKLFVDGREFVTFTHEQKTSTVHLDTNREEEGKTEPVEATIARFSVDGSTLAYSARSGYQAFSVSDGKELDSGNWTVDAVALSANGRRAALSMANCAVLRDTRGHDFSHAFRFLFQKLSTIAFSPDGNRMLLACGAGRMFTRRGDTIEGDRPLAAILWDLRTCEEVAQFDGIVGWPRSAAFDPKGAWLAIAGTDGIRVFDPETGEQLRRLDPRSEGVTSLQLSADGALLLAAGGTALILDTRTWGTVREFLGSEPYGPRQGVRPRRGTAVACAALSPDGALVAGACGKVVLLWDRSTGDEIGLLEHETDVSWIAFEPGGKGLAAATELTVTLWDTESRTPRWRKDARERLRDMAFAPTGLLCTSDENESYLLRAADGALVHKLPGARGTFLPGGRLVATQRGGMAKLIDARTGVEVCRLLRYTPGVVAIASGLYYASPKETLPYLSFRSGTKALPFEQMDAIYNRPDIVAESIGVAPPELVESYRHAYEGRLRRLGLGPDELLSVSDLPEVTVTSRVPLATDARSLDLTLEARDPKHPMRQIDVTLNGVPVLRVPLEGGPRAWKGEITVPLTGGKNSIQIRAVNQAGGVSFRETVSVARESKEGTSDLYVVAVGVGKYKDGARQLHYAAKDAADIARFFDGHRGPYREVHALPILDGEATREAIVDRSRAFLGKATIDDHVILFFAGHGLLDRKLDYYFGTVDVDFADPSARGLSYAAIQSLLDGIAPVRRLLLVDTCNAGEAGGETAETVVNTVEQGTVRARGLEREGPARAVDPRTVAMSIFADLRDGTGTHVIGAAGAMEFALESPEWKNGVFTFAVLRALRDREADADRSGLVTVSELRAYVMREVARLTRNRQRPASRDENPRVDFGVH